MNTSLSDLFLPDLFSDAGPRWYKAHSEKAVDVAHVLNIYYSVAGDEVNSIQQSNAIELNSNNYLVHTRDGKLVVKRWPMVGARDRVDMETQAQLANWLAEQRVSVPDIYQSKQTNKYVIEYQEYYWCVMNYIEGNYFSGAGNELRVVGEQMCGLFSALARAPDSLQVTKSIQSLGNNTTDVVNRLEQERAGWENIFGESHANILNESWADIKSDLNNLLAEQSNLKSQIGLCHIDLHPHNVLMISGKTAAILDYHSLMMAPREIIIAFNLFKLARQAIVEKGGDYLDEHVRTQIELIICELIENEVFDSQLRDQMSSFAKLEIMRRLLFIIELNINEKNQVWNHILPVQIQALKEADLVFP